MSSSSGGVLAEVGQIVELDDTCPLAPQPKNLKAQLKPHQLALIQRCRDLEKGSVPIMRSDGEKMCRGKLSTRIGIIADKVGSGKSYVIMSLLTNNDNNDVEFEPLRHVSTYAFDNVIIEHNDDTQYSKTSLLVIPHNLVKQWIIYLNTVAPALKTLIITTTKQLLQVHTIRLADYDVVMVSSTFYNSFIHSLRHNNIILETQQTFNFKRVIFDEVDTSPLKSCEKVKAHFIWFVTASYKNLLYPKGHGLWDNRAHRYIHIAEGIKCSGFIRNTFLQLIPAITNVLVVKNKDTFVDQSLQLPEIITRVVKCKTPRTISILHGLVDRNIINALNANDVEGAIQCINPGNRSSEEHIINILLEKYTRALQNAKTMARMIREELIYDNDALRDQEYAKAIKTQEEYENKIKNIDERIRSSGTCCICYDDITNKTIVDCCKNAFCFQCINYSLNIKQECPFCRHKPLGTDNLYVVRNHENMDAEDEHMHDAVIEEATDVSDTFEKIKNLEIIIKKVRAANATQQQAHSSTSPPHQPGKILIFSSFDNSFEQARNFLERENLRYALLKGSHEVIASVVNQYKKSDLDILLINPRNYGSGLNLENTTDIIMMHKLDTEIERQVVGRAQRYGRSAPLRVWYLVHENEM